MFFLSNMILVIELKKYWLRFFVFKKPLIPKFNTKYLHDFTLRELKLKRLFCSRKPGLNVCFTDF